MGNLMQLHTYSKYAKEKIDTSFIDTIAQSNSLQSDIQILEQRERELYRKYGAQTFEEFRKNIAKVFLTQDADVLYRFSAENLQSELAQFALSNKELYEYKEGIKIIVDTSKISNIKNLKLSTKGLKELGVVSNGENFELELSGQLDVGRLKTTMNKLFGKHYQAQTTATQYLDNFITSLTSEDGPLTIKIGHTNGAKEVVYEDEYVRHAIPNFPWGVTKALWEQAEKDGNRALLLEMEKATDAIYKFLYERLGQGASPNMHKAITNVWNSLCGEDFKRSRFFSGGKKNFISAVQGAMGEFQTALLFEYLQLQGMGSAFASIKGSTLIEGTGEQARSDVEVFRSIGIQVKNFNIIEDEVANSKYFLHDVHTRIHPDKLAKNFNVELQNSFLGFLANFYFNASYEKQVFNDAIRLRYALESWLGSVMNMAIKDATDEAGKDVVTFYMFGGRNLVPCSVILKAAEQLKLQQSLKIYSSYVGLTDKEYARQENGETKASLYWTAENGTWAPTDKNQEEYKNLISSRISIQTNFNFFDEIEKYALW